MIEAVWKSKKKEIYYNMNKEVGKQVTGKQN